MPIIMRNADEGIMKHISIIHHQLIIETGYYHRHQHYSFSVLLHEPTITNLAPIFKVLPPSTVLWFFDVCRLAFPPQALANDSVQREVSVMHGIL